MNVVTMDAGAHVGAIPSALNKASQMRIAVFGDYCLDKYLYIDPARDEPSLETGLTAYQAHAKRLFPGASGTVANNLRALGVNVTCVGLVGDDGEGYELMRALGNIGVDSSLMIRSDLVVTGTFMKPMRGDERGGYSEMSRIDIRNFKPTPSELEDALIANLKSAAANADGVMITEQHVERNFSVVTDRAREALSETARAYPGKFFHVDSRAHVSLYRDIIVKCNRSELLSATGRAPGAGMETVLQSGAELEKRNGKPVIMTAGEDGAYVFENGVVTRVPAFKVEGPVDIVGAGDSTSAGTMLGLTLGLSLPEAVLLGCCVASITIQQIGVTGTATVEQVRQRLNEMR